MSKLALAVNKVLYTKASAGENFTAYDITQAVRQEVGPSFYVAHDDVKALVHAAFLTGAIPGYDRANDASIGALRYSPVNGGATTGRIQASVPNPVQAPATPAPVTTTASVPGNGSSVAGIQTSVPAAQRNVLRVLKGQVGEAQFATGSKVKAIYSPLGQRIFIVPENSVVKTNDPRVTEATYSVDTKDNIRVNLAALGVTGSVDAINANPNILEVVLK